MRIDNDTKLCDLSILNPQKINYTKMIETPFNKNTFGKTDMISGYHRYKTFRNITDILTDCDKSFRKPLFSPRTVDTKYIEQLDGSIRHLKAANSTPNQCCCSGARPSRTVGFFVHAHCDINVICN